MSGMEYEPPDSPYRRAAERMVVAHDLISKQRFRQALDILNTAIVIAPTYPLAYALRAVVFDNLNLGAQAEADRLRERQLAATEGYPVADVVNGVATVTLRLRGGRVSRRSSKEGASGIGRLLSPAALGILMLVGVIAVGLGAVLLAIDTLDNGGNDSVLRSSFGPSPTVASATETPGVTEEPTPDPTADITGSPYSLSSAITAWENAGFTVTNNGPAEGFEGFDNTATSISLSGGGEFAVFVYEDASSTSNDWIISGTGVPDPQPGHTFPNNESIWFNANIIAVVQTSVAGAFEAFVSIVP